MDEPCSRSELRACLRDLSRLNRWFLAYRPILDWLDNVAPLGSARPLHILDVGCGYGDSLRRIERWAQNARPCSSNSPASISTLMPSPSLPKPRHRRAPSAGSPPTFFAGSPTSRFTSSSVPSSRTISPSTDLIRFLQWMESTRPARLVHQRSLPRRGSLSSPADLHQTCRPSSLRAARRPGLDRALLRP